MRMYLEDEDDDRQEDGETVHAPQVVPHGVVLLVGHPRARHEDEEQDVHYQQHDHQPEDLHIAIATMNMEVLSFLLTM